MKSLRPIILFFELVIFCRTQEICKNPCPLTGPRTVRLTAHKISDGTWTTKGYLLGSLESLQITNDDIATDEFKVHIDFPIPMNVNFKVLHRNATLTATLTAANSTGMNPNNTYTTNEILINRLRELNYSIQAQFPCNNWLNNQSDPGRLFRYEVTPQLIYQNNNLKTLNYVVKKQSATDVQVHIEVPTVHTCVEKFLPGYRLVFDTYYRLSDTSATWKTAKQLCNEQGSRLALINNPYEADALTKIMLERNIAFAWVGVQIVNKRVKTVEDKSIQETGFTKFARIDYKYECFGLKNFQLFDQSCLQRNYFICEKPGHIFLQEPVMEPCPVSKKSVRNRQ